MEWRWNRKVTTFQTTNGVVFEVPHFTIRSLQRNTILFYSAAKRLVFDRPNRGISQGMKEQMELSKIVENVNTQSRTIYFIRHGQSMWNKTFDRRSSLLSILWRIIRLLVTELSFAPTNDSFFYDSPLSMNGINQALELSKELSNSESPKCADVNIFRAESGQRCALFTSNLRRAQSTLMLALQSRLNHTGEVIEVCNELEELVPHPDCVSLSTTLNSSTIPFLEAMMLPDSAMQYSHFLHRAAGPGLSHLSAYKKMLIFNDRIFNQPEECIIVCGHSAWLMNYLTCFLPQYSHEIEYRYKKIGNLDTLRFELVRRELGNGEISYIVDPNSVKLVYKNTV
ncbi:uncharacterized protein BXIN_0629 [Babesia sp. Xinjiang]|uniref:uncharacterized protein n=1 Tax=Babesia sp. Xinjiang TaxID=462227 RepID=UPI000A23C912|nr:uncharacterized protein BXIN_0629 [Babesia sp. Xinjiang]ORM41810.1 hypothetical protein BXIN_0629 [Babesia sp. Xinjiang]